MPLRTWIRLAEFGLIATVATAVFISWRADRRDRAQLAATIAAANQQISSADARQHERDAQLGKTLAALATAKRSVTTPAQILRDLPAALPLPAPITLLSAPPGSAGAETDVAASHAQSGSSSISRVGTQSQAAPASSPGAAIPAQDLTPLYDFALDCQACRAKLAAMQGDLADEQAKIASVAHERDAALQAAKGGSLWRRLRRAAKWFAIGAIAGAATSRAVR